jgi:3-deoxy-D-manno-oct-2-ulosonic acid (Kdo) hydroxylase
MASHALHLPVAAPETRSERNQDKQDIEEVLLLQAPPKAANYTVFMTDGSGEITVSGPQSTPEIACQFLEKGGIIYFPETPFSLAKADREFLLSQKQHSADYFKNIAYRPAQDKVTGMDRISAEELEQMRAIMADFHHQVYAFLEHFLAPYAQHWKPDFATFRPIEEKGRKMRLRARNDLLHVDSFPTRPIYGDRILRTFLNINPSQNRLWQTSETCEALIKTFRNDVAPPMPFDQKQASRDSLLTSMTKMLGLKRSGSSSYDDWMMKFHNFLKENEEFQKTCRKDRWEFPPNSTWLVFTDMVSHSVLAGQFALEQTFIISKEDLVLPQKAPYNILKQVYGLH